MILKRITELNKATLSALFRHIQLPFSSIKLRTFSASAQKALWASAIIREILKAKPTSAFDSLQRRVKNLKLPASIQDSNEDIEKEMKEPFIQGIILDQFLYKNQTRLTEARKELNFIFCPSYTVTQPMFKLLFSIQKNYFLSGQFGTSKTISVILSNILSRPINNFKLETCNDQQKLNELKILEQLNILQYAPKFFYWSIPNISDNKMQKITIKQLIRQLKEQLTELQPSQLQEISKMNDIFELRSAIINSYWKRARIHTKVVIDQINTAASVIREWNNQISSSLVIVRKFQEQIKNQREEMIKSLNQCGPQNSNEIQEMYELRLKNLKQKLTPIQRQLQLKKKAYKKKQQQASEMIDLVNIYRKFGQFVLFNSSVNVEEDILTYSKLSNSPLLGLQILGKHYKFHRQHIHYFKALKEQQGRRDFFNFFWFEIERRLRDKPTQQVLEAFERKFYEIVKDIPIRHYSRPIFTYQFIQKEFENIRQNLLPLISRLDKQKTKEYLTKLFEQYNTYCLEQSKAKIFRYAKNENRKKVVTIISELAESLLQLNKSEIVISAEVFEQHFAVSLPRMLLSDDHNKELIPLEYDAKKNQITFHWSPQQFIEISKDITDPHSLFKSLMDNYNKTYFQRYPPSEGYYFQYTLVELLKPTVSFSFAMLAIKASSTVGKNDDPIYEKQPVVIFSVKQFTPFKKDERKTKKVDKSKPRSKAKSKKAGESKIDDKVIIEENSDSIRTNLSQILQESYSNPSKTIMGIPVNKKKIYNYRNPSFDFVLVTYNQEVDFYMIETFDATISRSSLDTKESDAKNFLAKLSKNKKGLNFEIRHTIICSSTQCANIWDEGQGKKKMRQSKYSEDQLNLVVKYSSYDGFELKYCPVTESFARMKFLGFRRFVQKNDKSKSTQEPQQKPTQTN